MVAALVEGFVQFSEVLLAETAPTGLDTDCGLIGSFAEE